MEFLFIGLFRMYFANECTRSSHEPNIFCHSVSCVHCEHQTQNQTAAWAQRHDEMLNTYPMRGLAPGRSWLFAHVMVTLLSVTLTTLGVPGGVGNVLGSGVRCKFKLPLFSTCKKNMKIQEKIH